VVQARLLTARPVSLQMPREPVVALLALPVPNELSRVGARLRLGFHLRPSRHNHTVEAFRARRAGDSPMTDSCNPVATKARWLPKLTCGLLCFLLAAGYAGCIVVYRAAQDIYQNRVPDSLAEEAVAGMVVEYMESHGGAWPRSWDDLKESARTCAEGWDFDFLRERVEIDFTVDLVEFAKNPPPEEDSPSQVLRLTSGKSHCLSGVQPNRRVWNYLQSRTAR
jgi:hypothetical protein